jgi:hypothetical protein
VGGGRVIYLFIFMVGEKGEVRKINVIFRKNLLRIYDRRAEAARNK